MNPLLTVVIINWNAQKYIINCLRSVLASDYPNLEIILIDNHSWDPSMYLVKERLVPDELKRITIVQNDRNYGCAYAENQGMNMARGKYLSIICADSYIEPDYFSEIVRMMESHSLLGAVGAKMLMMDDHAKIDSVGEYLTQYGILIQRHAGEEMDYGQFEQEREIFSIKGAGLTVRVDILKRIGGFPKDYFMFLEETDVCWRIWLAGYKIFYCPKAVIYHATSTSINQYPDKDAFVKYRGTRNYIYTCLKNYGLLNLFLVMPGNIAMWLAIAFYMLIKARFKEGWAVLRGVLWNFWNIFYILKNRKAVQDRRKVTDYWVMPRVTRRVDLRDLINKALYW